MSTIDEKRVYDRNTDPETAYVAGDIGVAAVSLVGERVGGFALRYSGPARDVVAVGTEVFVATPENVMRLGNGEGEKVGFGPARAVASLDGALVAAGENGGSGECVVTRYDAARGECERVGALGDVRAIDGDLIASAGGVYRIAGNELRYSGLCDARDVASTPTPRVATAEGVYTLANGWIPTLDGDFELVAGTRETPVEGLGNAHAAGNAGFYEYGKSAWSERALPTDETVVDVAYGRGVYAVTEAGTLLADVGEGWREHPLGVGTVNAIDVTAAR